MKPGMVCLIFLFVPALLLFTGCGGTDTSFSPVTVSDEVTVPAVVEAACGHILKYAASSSCLKGTLPDLPWKLEEVQYEGEYHYRNGDWLMVIWAAQAGRENQRVVIMNKNENAYWSGYVRPDGEVVDTSFEP